MPSPTFTERRLYRQAAALFGFQATPGTPVTNFTTAASRVLWMRDLSFNPGLVKEVAAGVTGTARVKTGQRFMRERLPVIEMIGSASPKNIEWLLRSWGGTWSGVGTLSFNPTEAINEFATLGIVEKAPAGVGNTQKLVRVWDSWIHRIVFSLRSGLSVLDAHAYAVAREYDETPLNALGGIVLPAAISGYMPPAIDVFAPHQFRLYRDPAGANVSIAVEELTIDLQHGVNHETWNDPAPQIVKDGPTRVYISLRSRWMDETYEIQDDAKGPTSTFTRFTAEFSAGSKAFEIDLHNVDFTVSPTGWVDGQWREFLVEGEAFLDGTDFVDITLAP